MRSESRGHFPQFRFSDGRKWLFNPVLKKRFANRPEERVRLRYVDFLLSATSITKNRIGFEAMVKTYSRDNSLRADLVIYSPDIKPMALIECKSERITLNEKTAEQAARYNLTLQADYLMITNGQHDFWYKRKDDSIISITSHPLASSAKTDGHQRPANYWQERGFLGSDTSDETAGIATGFLNRAFAPDASSHITYLKLPADISPEPLDHYYRIFDGANKCSLAFSLVAAPSGQTFLSCMLNRDGQNRGMIWLPLKDLLENGDSPAVRITPGGKQDITVKETTADLFSHSSDKATEKFVQHLINLFD